MLTHDLRYRLGALLLLLATGCAQTGDLVITYIESGSPGAGNDVYLALGADTFARNEYDYTDRTDAAGEVTFPDLAPGTYYYEVAGEGPTGLFALLDGTVEVESGETARVTVTGGRQ